MQTVSHKELDFISLLSNVPPGSGELGYWFRGVGYWFRGMGYCEDNSKILWVECFASRQKLPLNKSWNFPLWGKFHLAGTEKLSNLRQINDLSISIFITLIDSKCVTSIYYCSAHG